MAWYDVGTVSVTNGSTTVTGSGTDFISGAQVGEAFLAPDDKLYEIASITSATVLVLADAYLGSTQSGQDYKIVPTQSLVADLASDVTDLIADYADVKDKAGAGKFNDGSVTSPAITFEQDQNNGMFRIGSDNYGFSAGGTKQIDISTTDVELNYSGSKKLVTTSTGVDVTGTVTADGLVVDGDGDFVTSDGAILKLENSTTAMTSGNTIGEIQFYANDGSSNGTGAKVNIKATTTSSAGTLTDLTFGTSGSTSNTAIPRLNISAQGDVSFYEDTGTTAKMVWDASAESLGIGTSSPSAKLHISGSLPFSRISGEGTGKFGIELGAGGGGGTTVAGFTYDSTTGENRIGGLQSYVYPSFYSGGSERARIDSSGNLLVGQSSTTNPAGASVVGHSLNASGFISSCRASDFSANFGRTGTDGTIVNFAKDGSTVGSIGSFGSADLSIGTGDVGISFSSGGDIIVPHNMSTNTYRDGGINLGYAGSRFKDLYLSGASKANTYIFDGNASDPTGPTATVYDKAGTGLTHNGLNITFRTGSSSTERARIDSSGNLLVGTTTIGFGNDNGLTKEGAAVVQRHASTEQSGSTYTYFIHGGTQIGSINQNGTTGINYNTSSDYRLKENVTSMDNASDRVLALKPCRFNFIKDPDSTVDGFLAHEAQEVVPEAVHGTKDGMRTEEYEVSPAVEATYDEDGNELTPAVEAVMGTREVPDYQGIDQSKLVPLLTKALQESITKIEQLETRIETLENK